LHAELVAAPDAPSAARRTLAGFLASVGWSEAGSVDLTLAVSEAVTNAAQHAYSHGDRGLIVVRAHLVSDRNCRLRVWVCVTDQGRWREPPPPASTSTSTSTSARFRSAGWGVPLIKAVTAHVCIDAGATGTHVTMISHPDTAAPVNTSPDSATLPSTASR
jgi:anti-sigma regulatory factor (Ser/Thr protein kinase)